MAFTSAVQGSLKGKEWGSRIEALGDQVVGQTVSDQELMDRFTDGLSPKYAVHVALTSATYQREGKVLNFEELVCIASDLDNAEFVASKKPYTAAVVSSSSPSAPSPKIAAPSPNAREKWIEGASAWQLTNPIAKKDEWIIADDSRIAPAGLQCYNCGQLGLHYSRACTNGRILPRSAPIKAIAVAALKLSRSSSVAMAPMVSDAASGTGKADACPSITPSLPRPHDEERPSLSCSACAVSAYLQSRLSEGRDCLALAPPSPQAVIC